MTLIESSDSLDRIADAYRQHARTSGWWKTTDAELSESRSAMKRSLSTAASIHIGPLGQVSFTYVEMGAISSLDLFGLDELILFSFYWRNRSRYHSAVDLGANLGLHSIVLAKLGIGVTSYEPDPSHVQIMSGHVDKNELSDRIQVREAAVTADGDVVEFVRVLGNTTGSHVVGAKETPYGVLERFEVASVAFADALLGADLVKMDVEGLEAELLCSVRPQDLASVDIVCEVGSAANADRIWEHFAGSDLQLFAQKVNWEPAASPNDLPNSYREGSLFISSRSMMPWIAD